MHSQLLQSLAIGTFLVTLAVTNPTPSRKQCTDYVVPITTSTTDYTWGLPELFTDYDATALTTDLGRWDSNASFHPISGAAFGTASYNISGTFCAASNGGSETVLLASHGFGFDRRYFNRSLILDSQLTHG
jgi:hypothetical protein